MGQTADEQRMERKQKLLRRLRRGCMIKGFLLVAGVIILFSCIIGVTEAEARDMNPAVRPGDLLLFFRPGHPENTDVVIYEKNGEARVGRVLGGAGTEIGRTAGGLLTVRGNILPEDRRTGIFEETKTGRQDRLEYPSVCPSGKYLILGDARGEAKDSRACGYISGEDIKGRVILIIRRRPL